MLSQSLIISDIGKHDHAFDVHTQPAVEIQSHIPLSSIPLALQCLDLPPDDDQVLRIFRNAASGWSSSSSNAVPDAKTGEGLVSRDDWRSVCAVLFEHHQEEEYADDTEFDGLYESDGEIESEDPLFASENTDDGSDDEYVEGPAASSSRQHIRTRQAKYKTASCSPLSSSSPSKMLSPRQQQTCFEAFALFFPSVPASEVVNQKIMIKDIQRVAKLLGEKIKADEMVEMLEAFSTSADNCVGLEDFARMMVVAKLA
ncbi:hypothetical protein L208DRAFT_1425510 [Tricholoma matsutake]|nr:hypothetical protein L208DRAFT_1425510 [Tricholoma matsutake 945]